MLLEVRELRRQGTLFVPQKLHAWVGHRRGLQNKKCYSNAEGETKDQAGECGVGEFCTLLEIIPGRIMW